MLFSKSSILVLAMVLPAALGGQSCATVGYTFKCAKVLYKCGNVPATTCINEGNISDTDGTPAATGEECSGLIAATNLADPFSYKCPNDRDISHYSTVCANGVGLKCESSGCELQTCDSEARNLRAESLFRDGFQD